MHSAVIIKKMVGQKNRFVYAISWLCLSSKNTADYWYKHELHHASQFPTYFSYKSKEENEILSKSFSNELEKLSRIGELSSLFLTEECGDKIRSFIENEENLFIQWEFDSIELIDAHKSRLDKLKVLLDDIISEAKRELKVNKNITA